MTRNKRLTIALLFAVVIAAVFWSQSRVPALNEKAQMGLRTNFGSIAFDIVFPVTSDQPVAERVVKSTINWGYTNWKGMAFGLLFAAAALTVLGFVGQRSFRQPWLNTLAGMFVGAPLGVCVNCATPIAQGMYAAGARLETALATLFSSPTLNVIVLSMAFTLLPWELAAGSLIGVFLLLCAIPFLVGRFATSTARKTATSNIAAGFAGIPLPAGPAFAPGNESYAAALLPTLAAYSRNLIYMLKIALPLMFLAGFLGALAIELIPFNMFVDIEAGIAVFVGTAIFATLLPVPMAFNVIVVMALLANGMSPGLGAVLLFALGVYSIYPAGVIARYISAPLSIALAVTVVILATAIGLVTEQYFDYKLKNEQQLIAQGIALSQQAVYRNVINVCNELPGSLQPGCFASHIGDFDDVVGYEDMCRTRPDAVDEKNCRIAVDTFVAQQKALALSSSEPCDVLSDAIARTQCTFHVTFAAVVSEHDIGLCNQLAGSDVIRACRTRFLNASLLFSPDNSVCESLDGQEQSDCEINASIYRYAETRDFEGCDNLATFDAQEHCRYTTASSMIGQNDDSSGCLQLQTPRKRARCESLVTAWQAEREVSFALCKKLTEIDLQNLCLNRVAGKRIATILVDYTLRPPERSARPHADADEISAAVAFAADAPDHLWQTIFADPLIEIAHTPYRSRSGDSTKMFSRVSAAKLGISESWDFRMTDFFEPFIVGRGIASGDFNNDLWPDLVLATEHGVLLYQNTGGQFQLLDVDQGELAQKNVFVVALVDADNDGSQDVFASAYGGTNYLLLNKNGGLQSPELMKLDGEQRLTFAAGFADLNQNGQLDIVLGNWSSGVEKLFSPEQSVNQILFRQDDNYRSIELDEVKGETLTVLLADINGDHHTDLLIGNDRLVPDAYYLGNGDGSFNPITLQQGLMPVTSMFTMSLDAADFDNDLKPDLYSVDMTFARSSKSDYCMAIEESEARSRCAQIIGTYTQFSDGNASVCGGLDSPRERQECFAAFSVKAAKEQKKPGYCDNLVDRESALFSLCRYLASPVPPELPINQQQYIQQVQRNVLLMNRGGRFVDEGQMLGVDKSFWSWNAKAADLDNDGWQDIYVGNGFHFGDSFYEIQENVLFHNQRGEGFARAAPQWGLDDAVNTPSYTYLDFDLDGDMDIIATGVLAPPRVFINQQKANNSVTFVLDDEVGNSSAIGAKVTISYGGDQELQQRKENKLSGGFMSFDNPVLHFGVGKHESIDGFTIQWSGGTMTEHVADLPANRIYRVTRKAD